MSPDMTLKILVLSQFIMIIWLAWLAWNQLKIWDAINDTLRVQLEQLTTLFLVEEARVSVTCADDQSKIVGDQ
jgi:hypothetical protein